MTRGNPAQRTRNTVSPIGPDVKILNLPSCEERQCICIYFSRKCHSKCISHSILTFENYRQTWNIIFTWFYLKFSSQSMKRTYNHNIIFVREILLQAPWLHRYRTTERGEVWWRIADNLNAMEKPMFKVTQRSVRGRYSHMEKRPKSLTKSEQVGFAQKNLKSIRRRKK